MVKVCIPTFPASIWFSSPEMFLSFFDFACASRGFFPTHFSLCFPPILQSKDVIQATCAPSACPPVNVSTSPRSSAGFPMVLESNGT